MRIKFLFLAFTVGTTTINAQELPPNAVPGKCYIKCTVNEDLREETETIQISPSYKKLKTIPATFKVVEHEVMIKEPSVKKVFRPAVYETVLVEVSCKEAEQMALKDGSKGDGATKYVNYRAIPAKLGNDQVTVQVSPKMGKWEYTQLKECPSADKDDCIVACYVEKPSRTVNIPIRTLVNDASVQEIPIPCQGFTYKKRVIKTPARVDEIPIPAQYGTVKRKVIDRPARVIEAVVPAKTKTVTKYYRVDVNGNRIADGSSKPSTTTVWEEVDCNIASGYNLLPINYELNSARLTSESIQIINKNLLSLMKEKRGLRVEISSHTDSRADDSYNKALSQQRANAVVNYLVRNGISRRRLVARGYGESRLKNNCGNNSDCTEAEHSVNRRTEFRIIR